MSQGTNWSTQFPVYQIDFQAIASGKHIASTKRKVRWRFGFPNKQALDAGRSGVDCRGEEHDVVIIWSLTSGKRQAYMDGSEIHFSTSRGSSFQYSWSGRGNHVIKVIAHAAPPMQPVVGFRQYDLYVDGQSFFNMPKAYELGLIGFSPHQGAHGGYGSPPARTHSGIRAPASIEEEETDLQRAINASLQKSRQYLANKEYVSAATAPSAPQAIDLMDFSSQLQTATLQPAFRDSQHSMPPAYAAPPAGQYASPIGSQQSLAYPTQPPLSYQSSSLPSNVLVPSGTPSQPYALPASGPRYHSSAGAPHPPPPTYGGPTLVMPPPYSPPSTVAAYGGGQPAQPFGSASPAQVARPVSTADLFAHPRVDPFAPAVVASRDPYGLVKPMSAYDDPFAPKPPPPATHDEIAKTILNAYGPPSQPGQQGHAPPQQPGQAGQPLPITNGGQTGADALIRCPPLTIYGALDFASIEEEEKPMSDMENAMKRLVNVDRIDEPAEKEYTLTMKKEAERVTKDGKSKGLPPVATGLVGSNATLDHIKQVKPNTTKTGEGVMRAPPQLFHADAVNAGALVIHGQGPPPIQRDYGVGYGGPAPNFQQQRW